MNGDGLCVGRAGVSHAAGNDWSRSSSIKHFKLLGQRPEAISGESEEQVSTLLLKVKMINAIKSPQNLDEAFKLQIKLVKKHKRHIYLARKDKIIKRMQAIANNPSEWELNYMPPKKIFENGKEREIVRGCFIDKCMQRAILLQIQEVADEIFILHTYQSIKGRGLYKAVDRLARWISKLKSKGEVHYLQMDIKRYYESIDIDILKHAIKRFIPCTETQALIHSILRGNSTTGFGKGVTLGDSISQMLGNMYLHNFDYYAQQIKGVRYLRYADDLLFLSNCKHKLRQVKGIVEWDLKKRFNVNLSRVKYGRLTENNAMDTLGYKFYINRMEVRKRIRIHLSKCYERGKVLSIPSILGHFKHAKKY